MAKNKRTHQKHGEKQSEWIVRSLDKEYDKGFTAGLALVLLGYYNTVDDYIPDEEKQKEFFHKWEDEVNRIIRDELKGDTREMAESATVKIMDIRKEWGLMVI